MTATRRFRWRSGAHAALDHRFGIRCTEPEAAWPLAAALADLAVPGRPRRWYDLEGGVDRWRLTFDGVELGDDADLAVLLGLLLWHLNREAVRRTGGGLLLHAGAVGAPQGAVLVTGASGAGKSTLVAGLVLDGFAYLGDEVAALDAGAHHPVVAPYPKPLALDGRPRRGLAELLDEVPAGAIALGGELHLAASALRAGSVATAPVPVAAVVAPEFRPGSPARIERRSPGEAAFDLARQAFSLGRAGEGLDAVGEVARRVPMWRLRFGSSADGRALVRRCLEEVAGATAATDDPRSELVESVR